MARPLNKTQLLSAIDKEYGALEKYITTLTPEQMAFRAAPGAWAVKDILAHLVEWQRMLSGWYESGLRGEKPAVPAPGYKWSQLPALNQSIYEKYCDLPPADALALFHKSHRRSVEFIESLTDADLITPGLYPWMNQNTLLSYLNSTTAAHYVWALKEVKTALKG